VLNGILNFCYGVLIFPEEHKLWHKYGVREGLRYLQGAKIDAILSSSSPITSHLIANSLKKKFPRPWLADLRDLWTQNHYYLFGPLFKFIERNIELNTLSRADLLVTVSRPLATRLSTLHSSKTCQSIPNGFDPDDYKFSSQPLDEKFSIVYTGGLLQGKRDPDSLLNAVRELLDENKLSAEDLQIKFFGRDQYWLQKDIAKNRLGGIAVQCPQLPRQEIQQTQRRAQLLLLLNWNDPREVGVYTGKVFEYLAARRPILAVGGPQGVISELMTATHAGNHVREKDEIKRTLLKHYEEYKKTGAVSYNGREDEVMKFSHKQMAMKFAQALNQLTQSDVVLA